MFTAENVLSAALCKPYFGKLGKSAFFLIFTFLIAGVGAVSAQDAPPELPVQEKAPPPLKILPKSEKERLEAETDLKKRTILALDLMDARLKRAEEMDSQNQFLEMYDELGKFHALMDYTLNFLHTNNMNNGKSLNNFKRFEIGLRAYPPRLEIVRRNLPIKYEHYVRTLIKTIRETRSKAVENFFADTVVPN